MTSPVCLSAFIGACPRPLLRPHSSGVLITSCLRVRFWRRKSVTMKVLICVRCVSPLARDTSLSRASHSPVTSLPSVPQLRQCGTAGRVMAASGACPPPWRQGTPGSRGPRNPRSPASAWRLMVSSINFLLFIVRFAMESVMYKISLATEENVLGCCHAVYRY